MTEVSEERLARIEADQARMLVLMESLTEKVERRMGETDLWRSRLERTIYGDGNGNPGHHIKLDRLLQAQDRQKWMIRAVVGGVIALAVQAILGGLTG